MKNILLCILIIATSLNALAQAGKLTGKVSDANNNPLAGASVSLAGNKTTTDKDGTFSIDCEATKNITVSFVGFEPFHKKITACNEVLEIKLTPANGTLDEVEITASSNSNKKLLYQPQSIDKLGNTELKRGTGIYLADAINTSVPGVIMESRTVAAASNSTFADTETVHAVQMA